MNNSVADLFTKLVLTDFPVSLGDHLVANEVTTHQLNIVNLIYYIFEGNLKKNQVPLVHGGKLNCDSFNLYSQSLRAAVQQNPVFQAKADALLPLIDQYLLFLQKQIAYTCSIRIGVENLPFKNVLFCTQPVISWTRTDPVRLFFSPIGYCLSAELSSLVPGHAALVFPKGNKHTTPFFTPLRMDALFSILPLIFTKNSGTPLETDASEYTVETQSEFGTSFTEKLTPSLIPFMQSVVQSDPDAPWLSDISKHDQELGREGDAFSAFLNADPQLLEAMEDLSPFEVPFDLDHETTENKSPSFILPNYTLSGVIRRIPDGSFLLVYDHKTITSAAVQKTLMALVQMGASCEECPHTVKIHRNQDDDLT